VSRTSFYRWVERARTDDAPYIYYEFAQLLNETRAHRSEQFFESTVARAYSQLGSVAAARDQAFAGYAAAAVDAGHLFPKQPAALAAPAESQASEHPVPQMTCATFACLPRRLRHRFLKMIHTFTKDLFIREKLWTKMNDTERVLLKLIAKEICMQPTLVSEPVTFNWKGADVTRTFDTYEFLEPVSMNLIIRYLRDQNHRITRRQREQTPSESPSLQPLFAECASAAASGAAGE